MPQCCLQGTVKPSSTRGAPRCGGRRSSRPSRTAAPPRAYYPPHAPPTPPPPSFPRSLSAAQTDLGWGRGTSAPSSMHRAIHWRRSAPRSCAPCVLLSRPGIPMHQRRSWVQYGDSERVGGRFPAWKCLRDPEIAGNAIAGRTGRSGGTFACLSARMGDIVSLPGAR